jgi:hypothetical protein
MPSTDPARLDQLRRWAVLLDSAFAVPGVPIRFGVDAIIGLVPGLGDVTTPAFTVLLLATGVRMRVPMVVLARMVLNAGLDAAVGLVPVLGDLVDIGWKANLRNLALLERYAVPGATATRGDAWVVAGAAVLIALVCALALLPIVLAIWLLARLTSP